MFKVHFVTKSNNGTFTVFAYLFKLTIEDNPKLTFLLNAIGSANAMGTGINIDFLNFKLN